MHCRLSCHAASLVSRHTLHNTPSLSCHALPLSSLVASLLSRCLSPLSLPLSSPLITPHSARKKVGCCVIKWCTAASPLCSVHPPLKTVHRPLTTPLGAPPPLLSCCLSLVTPHPSCHAIPLLLRFASLISCRLSPLSSPLSLPLITPHSARNKVGCCIIKRCTDPIHLARCTHRQKWCIAPSPPCSVYRRLYCHAASLLSLRTLHVTPSLSCHAMPLLLSLYSLTVYLHD